MVPVRCEACDSMLDEGAMLHGLCTPCKHAVAMCLDLDDDDLAFTTGIDNTVEIISLEDGLLAEESVTDDIHTDDQSECV